MSGSIKIRKNMSAPGSDVISGYAKIGNNNIGITYYGIATTPVHNDSNSASPTVITPPASMLSGDLVVISCFSRLQSIDHAVSETGGQSWTELSTTTASYRTLTYFYCTYNGTWSASPSFSHGGTSNTCLMLVFRPTSGYTWSVDVTETPTAFDAPGSPYAVTATGINCAASSVMITSWHSIDDNDWTYTSGGATEVAGASVSNLAGSDSSNIIVYKLMPAGGATGDQVATEVAVGGDVGIWNIMSFKVS